MQKNSANEMLRDYLILKKCLASVTFRRLRTKTMQSFLQRLEKRAVTRIL